jgi:hypothetical protein
MFRILGLLAGADHITLVRKTAILAALAIRNDGYATTGRSSL